MYFFSIGCEVSLPQCASSVIGACSERTAAEDSICIHHPRLHYVHLGLIRFDLFEVVNGEAYHCNAIVRAHSHKGQYHAMTQCAWAMPTCGADAE